MAEKSSLELLGSRVGRRAEDGSFGVYRGYGFVRG